MDNVTSTRWDVKTTNPGLPIPPRLSIDEDDAPHIASGPFSQPAIKYRRKGSRRNFFRGYGAALVMGLPILPIVVSAVTVVVYLSNTSLPAWLSVVIGGAATQVAWFLGSLMLVSLTSPRNANSRSYGLLESRRQQLQSRLHVLSNEYPLNDDDPKYKALPEYQKTALN